MHLLLAIALGDVERQGRAPDDPSLTSREILAHAKATKPAIDALRDMVSAVEVSHFGGRPVSLTAFEACLGHYRTFHQAMGN